MDIVAELRAAAKAQLQRDWDTHLITSWRTHGKTSMRSCVSKFVKSQRIRNTDVFDSLRRVPRLPQHWHSCVGRFVAAYLPKINNALFNGNLTDEQIALAAYKLKMDTLDAPVDASKAKRERAEVNRAEKSADANTLALNIRRQWRQATSRSNWTACK